MARRRRRSSRGLIALVVIVIALAVGAAYGPLLAQRALHPLEQRGTIAKYAREAGVDPYLVAAVINVESGFRTDVVSSAGAVGLMQLMPSTAQAVAHATGIKGKMDVGALSDPVANVRIGTLYLAELVARYHGDTALALAAYNAGMGNADAWAAKQARDHGQLGDIIDFPETAHYIDEVDAQAAAYRRLYPGVFAGPVK